MKTLLAIGILFLLAQLGCEKSLPSKTTTKEALRSVEDAVKDASKMVSKYKVGNRELGELADSELEKLMSIEYRVLELSLSDSTATMNEELANLGKERWDCFHSVQIEDKLRFFCKRQTSSYLRYLLRSF